MCLSMQAEHRQVVPTPPMLLCRGRPHSEPLMAVVESRAYVVRQSSAEELRRHVRYRRFAAMTGYMLLITTNATTVNVVLLSARIIIPSSLAD